MAWVICADGCGLHHRPGDAAPLHDAAWLARERVRLLGEVVNVRVRTLVAMADGIDERARDLMARFNTAVEQGQRQGIVDDLNARWCETFEARALVARLAGPPADEDGVVFRNWITPKLGIVEAFREAREELARHGIHIDSRRYFEERGYPMLAAPDELAAARERRDGTPISLESRADPTGVVVDVDLGTPPKPRT